MFELMATNDYPKAMCSSDVHQVVKPHILESLEKKSCCLSVSQTLSAIEIVVFIFNVLKKCMDEEKELTLKQLYLLLKEYMRRQMKAIDDKECCQQMVRQQIGHGIDYQKMFLSNLLTDFIACDIIQIDNNLIIGLHNRCKDERRLAVHQMVDNILIGAFEEFLVDQLNKYGPKAVDEVEMRLIRSYNYSFHYLFSDQSGQNLMDFCDSKQNLFVIHKPNEPNMRAWLSSRSYRPQHRVDPQPCYLSGRLRITNNGYGSQWYIECDGWKQSFEIDSNVSVFGLQKDWSFEDLIHNGDRVEFLAKISLTTHNDGNNNDNYCWLVYQITKVTHFGSCYVIRDNSLTNSYRFVTNR